MGGIGLALLYLLREAPRNGKATDPDVPLIFMNGPLTGTPAVNSSDVTIVSFHHLTPYSAAVGHTHGFWGAYLMHAGTPGHHFSPAGHRGPPTCGSTTIRSSFATRATSGARTQGRPSAASRWNSATIPTSVSPVSGPAGEAGIAGAMIKNDRNHGAGKG